MVGDFVRRRNKNKVKIYTALVLLIVVSFISIGYAYLSRDLSMAIDVKIKPSNLYNKIIKYAVMDNKKSKYVTSSTGIDFSQISSDVNGKGIYMLSSTKNDDYPIYYYRGAVENNNVLFANFCWKVVRTTETGGIKLIYNGVPDSNGACNNVNNKAAIGIDVFNTKADDNAYVGYMYGTAGSNTYEETHKNTNDSAIKKKIDTWYKNNMTDYTHMLEDTVWCNDRSLSSGSGTGSSVTQYGAYDRLASGAPSLECKNQNDRFTVSAKNGNGALTYPVAMLTADEVAYAGGVWDYRRGDNNSYYLYTGTGLDYWTLSPNGSMNNRAISFYMYSSGKLAEIVVHNDNVVRPSISLKSNTEITGGNGTVDSPYVVKLKERVKLYDEIKKVAVADNVQSEFVTSSTGISFSKISSDTNGKGVYMLSSTANDTNPIYYYRGAVENNNVRFANFCWKIVRTTETGGIKLIYNGKPSSSGACNNMGDLSTIGKSAFNKTGKDNTYVGYMYGTAGASSYDETHKNTNDSTIKTAIDTWYKNNMTSYTKKLEDTVWCNDRSLSSGTGVGTNETLYGAFGRLYFKKAPSLECKNLNDRFTVSTKNGNGALTYPVALLTEDEAAYAGGKVGSGNDSYYLYTSEHYYTLSPSGDFMNFIVASSGFLNCFNGTNAYGVRPMISLVPDSMFIDGDGSVNNPYEIE